MIEIAIVVIIVLLVAVFLYRRSAAAVPETTWTLSGADPKYKSNGTYVFVSGPDASGRKTYKATSPPAPGQDPGRYVQILHDGTILSGNQAHPGGLGPASGAGAKFTPN